MTPKHKSFLENLCSSISVSCGFTGSHAVNSRFSFQKAACEQQNGANAWEVLYSKTDSILLRTDSIFFANRTNLSSVDASAHHQFVPQLKFLLQMKNLLNRGKYEICVASFSSKTITSGIYFSFLNSCYYSVMSFNNFTSMTRHRS